MVEVLFGVVVVVVLEFGWLYDLYESVVDFLGDDVFYLFFVILIKWSKDGVKLVVCGDDKKFICINVKCFFVLV